MSDQARDEEPDDRLSGEFNPGASSLPAIDPVVERLAEQMTAETDPDQAQQAFQLAFGHRFQGPVPSPEDIRSYNAEGSQLGTRLIEDHFIQREHERGMDRKQMGLAYRETHRADREQIIRTIGLFVTYVFLGGLVAGAIYLGLMGHDGLAVACLSPALLTVLGVVIRQFFPSARSEPD